jgi:excinuclease ABC subunit A
VDGGRCDACKGEGRTNCEMQFLAMFTLHVRYAAERSLKKKVLRSNYKRKNIHDVLEMSVDEAIVFFSTGTDKKDVANDVAKRNTAFKRCRAWICKARPVSNTLSGGEAQRVKLASFLGKGKSQGNILFIFDEPTTGLHFHDIKKIILASFNALIEQGHTILVIEHNTDVIKSADWVIDLGPRGRG